jgi:chromosome partitioning protein
MIIAIVGRKGGIGKTTSAVNLAAAFAARGKRTLLVDLDSQCSASLSLGVHRASMAPSIADVLMQSYSLEAAVRSSARLPGLDLVTCSVDLINLDETLANAKNRERLLKAKLDPARERYEYIVLDCPPALSLASVNALVAADGYIVPAVPQFLAIEGIQNLLSAVERLAYRTQTRPKLLGVLLTMVDYRIKTTHETVSQLRGELGNQVFATEVRINSRLAEAPRYGRTIFEYDPLSRGADAYGRLASELLDGRPTVAPLPLEMPVIAPFDPSSLPS